MKVTFEFTLTDPTGEEIQNALATLSEIEGVYEFTATQSQGDADDDSSAADDGNGGIGSLVVSEIHADAEQVGMTNLNDEYIVLKNTSTDSLDLTGCTVQDDIGQTYRFPDGFTLAGNMTVTLHTGSGEDTRSDLYWGQSSEVWSDREDTIIIRDADGNVVVEKSYPW